MCFEDWTKEKIKVQEKMVLKNYNSKTTKAQQHKMSK